MSEQRLTRSVFNVDNDIAVVPDNSPTQWLSLIQFRLRESASILFSIRHATIRPINIKDLCLLVRQLAQWIFVTPKFERWAVSEFQISSSNTFRSCIVDQVFPRFKQLEKSWKGLIL